MSKKIDLFRKLGNSLYKKAVYFLRHSFKFEETWVNSGQLQSILEKKYNIPDKKIYCADEKYRIPDIDTVKLVVKYDALDAEKYVADRWDCDSFADAFAYRFNYIYGFNSIGTANMIKIVNEDGKTTGYHRANLIIATDNGEIKTYFFEPQTDEMLEIDKYSAIIETGVGLQKLNYFEIN